MIPYVLFLFFFIDLQCREKVKTKKRKKQRTAGECESKPDWHCIIAVLYLFTGSRVVEGVITESLLFVTWRKRSFHCKHEKNTEMIMSNWLSLSLRKLPLVSSLARCSKREHKKCNSNFGSEVFVSSFLLSLCWGFLFYGGGVCVAPRLSTNAQLLVCLSFFFIIH